MANEIVTLPVAQSWSWGSHIADKKNWRDCWRLRFFKTLNGNQGLGSVTSIGPFAEMLQVKGTNGSSYSYFVSLDGDNGRPHENVG